MDEAEHRVVLGDRTGISARGGEMDDAAGATSSSRPPSGDTLQDLGVLDGVRVQLAVDPEPWKLPIDTLVVSVGPGGLGQLGAALRRALPGLPWQVQDLRSVTPDEPRLLVIPAGNVDVRPPVLRQVIFASAREGQPATSRFVEPPATLEAVRRATTAAVRLGLAHGARELGLPLLGAGAIGFPNSEAAFEVVSAVRSVLRGPRPPGERLTRLVFVCRDGAAGRAIQRVWGYGQMLVDAREEALRDEVLGAEATAAGLSEKDLAQVLDVPDEVLWHPCVSELTRLRHIDTDLDDLRNALVGSLDRERQFLEQEQHNATARKGRRRVEALADVERGIEDMLQRDSRWRELARSRDDAVAELRTALLGESLQPRLRQAINDRLATQRRATHAARRKEFRRLLTRPDTTGLRGAPGPGGLVHTAAHYELDGFLDPSRSSRASVGVAGPRGCGKSTLLTEYTAGWTRGLSILVPAPASYASRDFLLHLYSLVCQGVLDRDREPRVRMREGRVPPARLRATSRLALVVMPALVLLAGVSALAASPAWGHSSPGLRSAGGAVLVAAVTPYLVLRLSPLPVAATPFASLPLTRMRLRRRAPVEDLHAPPELLLRDQLRWQLPGPERVLLGAVAVGGFVVAASLGLLTMRRTVGLALLAVAGCTAVFSVRRTPPQSAAVPGAPGSRETAAQQDSSPRAAVTSGDAAAITHVGLSRRSGFLLAVASAQLTLAVVGAVLLGPDPATAPLDATLVIGAVLVAAGLAALLPGLRWHTALERELAARLAPPEDPHSFRARQDLDKIRYQRSVSSGWTSSVKVSASSWLPFGADAGFSGTTTEAEVPLSVPEIVDGIKTLLPARGPALLAIDELDKIESVNEARDFLNEVKGILGAHDTRFLVSMSEDAIARFERRGLPFRDVFDSAFDEVVRVPYLSAAQARVLLNQRVTNVPDPFVALAFSLSGGLPRDLLRAADRVVTAAPATGAGVTLDAVVREVVHVDIAAKTEAVTAGMKSISVEPDVSALIRAVQEVDACRLGQPRERPCLLDHDWLAPLNRLGAILGSPESSDLAERRELLRLGVELVGYLSYCRTLLELFKAESDEEVDRLIALSDGDDGRRLDELGRARQNFAVNPFVAWEQLNRVRRALGLATCELPTPFLVGAAGPKGCQPRRGVRVAGRRAP